MFSEKQKPTLTENHFLRWSHEKNPLKVLNQNSTHGTSLVAEWLRICLPMQGTQAQSLVREDSTCLRASKSMLHNYWACMPRACTRQQEKPPQWEARASQQRVDPAHCSQKKKINKTHPFRLPCGSDGKASACNAGDPGSIPGSGRSPGEGNGNHSSTLA